MDVRAYSQVIQEHFDRSAPNVVALQLKTLRLEVLSPSVMIALFQGIPKMVTLDEPHHGIQFGVAPSNDPLKFTLGLRDLHGQQIAPDANNQIPVPLRPGSRRVVDILSLWKRITNSGEPQLPPQTGGGRRLPQAPSSTRAHHF